jgi:hypothetical protein
VIASAFRAEFTQFAGGPRILELDAYNTRPLVVPAVVVAPASQTIARNVDATLHVLARGGNLQYQWKFKGVNIAGATTDTLVVSRFQNKDQGAYTVTVTNPLGSVTSQAANLTLASKK